MSSANPRMANYKKGTSSLEQLREKARNKSSEFSKNRRAEAQSLKRMRYEYFNTTANDTDVTTTGVNRNGTENDGHSGAVGGGGSVLLDSEEDIKNAEEFLKTTDSYSSRLPDTHASGDYSSQMMDTSMDYDNSQNNDNKIDNNNNKSSSSNNNLLSNNTKVSKSGYTTSGYSYRMQKLVHELLKEVQSKRSTRRTEALRQIRRLLSHKKEEVMDIFIGAENSIDTLIDLLTGCNSDDQLEAAWCFCNISAGNSAHTEAASKASPYLINFLSGSNIILQDQAAWALANIAADSITQRDKIVAQGAIFPLVKLLQSSQDISVVKSVAFALGNLARGQNADHQSMISAGILPALAYQLERLLSLYEMKTFSEVCWVLTYLTTITTTCMSLLQILPLLSDGLYIILHEALSGVGSSYISLVDATPIIRVMANFVATCDESVTLLLLNSHSEWMSVIMVLLSCDESHIVTETTWLLANVTATSDSQVAAMAVVAGVIPILVPFLSRKKNLALEAAHAIVNISSQSFEYLASFVTHGAIEGFNLLLESSDTSLISISLEFFKLLCECDEIQGSTIIEDTKTVALLESLCYHGNSSISKTASSLVDQYFRDDDD